MQKAVTVIMLIQNPGVLIQSFVVQALPSISAWPPVSFFHSVCAGRMGFLGVFSGFCF